ncbi:aldehyde dehydrogenase family 3 member H1 isoform X2 [Selaginella moellendorffii]|uniref:aldehyde dehydrogenase family 3 member H1 isoform X2 n=1 Tax=Selaginella moellendorffii TaxID=88036 RepID=UPI000D1CF34C|nr:aldehyde dehydrogenase family 3 member H1 isoform X2 [Selaginella moellendorffii]|eukprot:XP_024538901.1 aldehyde dehydrogenase family 3 member H1 isoform X2 [Selaginella moellendorffii]
MEDEEATTLDINPRLREGFRSGRTRSSAWRSQQLHAIARMIDECDAQIYSAVAQDTGKSPFEVEIFEIFPVKSACQLAIKNLKNWTAAVNVPPLLATLPASASMKPEPFGVVLIISAWNFPFLLSLDPMVGAIAAGNAVVLKPSEMAPATSALIARLLPLYLDKSAIRVVEGGIPETTALLQQKWDKIFYTGSPRVGRIVMAEAAKNLTPVTLELGGKSPVIVDSSSDLKVKFSSLFRFCLGGFWLTFLFQVATRRIAVGKWGNNNGQACVSPDYVLVDSSCSTKFIEAMKDTLKSFYGENPRESMDISRVVNINHFNRLVGLLDDPNIASKIAHGGEKDETKLYIAPTLLEDVPLDSKVMSEEIFGPILPIISVRSIDEAIDIVNSRPKPLALYLFTKKDKVKEKVIAETSAGGMVVNDCCLHFLTTTLPFGGVGESGMGSYHGKFSFDAFSHHKAILTRPFWMDIMARYPPYSAHKKTFIRCLLEADFVGVILCLLGLKG